MDRSTAARAQRDLEVVRIDLAVMRSEVKALWHLARSVDNAEGIRATRKALDHLDQAMVFLADARVFHPTLF